MTTPSSKDSPDPSGQDAPPASVAEQAAAALDVSEDVLEVLEEVVQRLTTLEGAVAGTQRGGSAPENRTDFRFESYPAAETDKDQGAQVSRARAAWERLDTWVTWLTATYRLTNVIPPCWADHTALREELIGLRVAWTGAWSPRASNEAIVIWHEKLWSARARLLDGNWGSPRCDGRHDDSGLDLADSHRAWVADQRRDHALIAARDHALETVRSNWPTGDDPS
jgi:hypothetical protein